MSPCLGGGEELAFRFGVLASCGAGVQLVFGVLWR